MAWKVGHPVKRDGASQRQRFPPMLSPEQVPVDARPPEELLAMLYRIAGQFSYYDLNDQVDGTFQAFFPDAFLNEKGLLSVDSIRDYLTAASQKRDNGPFMTILLAFLHLYRYLQADINRLSGEHLKYYYEQVLRFQRRPPQPDRVHVLFELSPQVNQHYLPAGTELKAGKDNLGKPLHYVTDRDIVVNRARIAQLKTILVEPTGRIYAAEVANSADGLGAPLVSAPPAWPAFGHPSMMQLSTVGFAIASHLLWLQEGQRTITVTLTFESLESKPESPDAKALFSRLIPYASGKDDWIELQLRAVQVMGSKVILDISVRPDQPAITTFNAEKLEGYFDTEFPVLKLLQNPQQPFYHQLKNLKLQQIDLTVKVDANSSQAGLQQLVVQNDYGVLDAGGSFQPFGPAPSVGSLFYIGSREAFSKPLTGLTIQIRWADLPGVDNGFNKYYEGYNPRPENNGVYTVSLAALASTTWQPFGPAVNLFDSASGKLVSDRTIPGIRPNLRLHSELPEFEQWDASLVQGFIRLRLNNRDFGHKQYPKIFATEAAKRVDPPNFPNPPYTPTIQSISLGYESTQSIQLNQTANINQIQLFHCLPFGSERMPPPLAEIGNFLPDLALGNLYIGLEKLQPPQNVYLLFQALEGSAESVDAVRQQDIQWHYLTAAGWSPLSGPDIVTDTTEGLQQPGMMVFNIGRDAVNRSTVLPSDLHWLRASIQKDPAGAAQMVTLETQVVTAVFDDRGNDPDHLSTPLAANRISALNQRNSAIKKVSQPYPSFNGVPAEQDIPFYSRISERLRHKQRAVNLWDYERMVLAAFPQVYKAKSIPHTAIDTERYYSEFLPGHTSIVVIPRSRQHHAVNALEPKASTDLIEKIGRYLRAYGSGFVGGKQQRLQVINPRYEPVRVSCSVGFHAGFDGGYYREVLNDALRRHLSPWAYDDGADIPFGGKVYKSQLLAFVEEQPYVDYVTDFKLFHQNAGPGIGEMSIDIDFVVRGNEEGDEVEVASASTAASILVSAKEHQIEPLRPDEYPCDEAELCGGGIGCMYINIDFIVGATDNLKTGGVN
ncbi:baseplate J-like protein [Nitrosomonas nitrosa]|uniref:baseplate J/gp47 family protein n=1 Tax=Nitrosomonas nitrosa TaxID=52442 RepID=UPI000D311BBD|nr:baseplate J/gp47 family protein [Nitrosomonas nitrosa]PTQ91918.1 baseplate J-like protein [Nitrosomonas nitrosa]